MIREELVVEKVEEGLSELLTSSPP